MVSGVRLVNKIGLCAHYDRERVFRFRSSDDLDANSTEPWRMLKKRGNGPAERRMDQNPRTIGPSNHINGRRGATLQANFRKAGYSKTGTECFFTRHTMFTITYISCKPVGKSFVRNDLYKSINPPVMSSLRISCFITTFATY